MNKAQRTRTRSELTDYKLAHGCADCEDRWEQVQGPNPDALQFDHIHGEKLFNVSQFSQFKVAQVWEEVAKCEVRCAICHSIRSSAESRIRNP